MIHKGIVVSTNPITGKFRGMEAGSIMSADGTLDGLSDAIWEMSKFEKIIYLLTYFKKITHRGHFFVKNDQSNNVLNQVKKFGFVCSKSKYNHEYDQIKILLTLDEMSVVILST